MAIKRYFASKDNTISNAFTNNLTDRGTDGNMGASDILEAFVIHGQTNATIDDTPSANNATNAEQTRFLVEFPISTITSDMADGTLPADTGSIKFYLNLFNAPHGDSTPLGYDLDVFMLSETWSEGTGLDMDNYTDLGSSNWVSSSAGVLWTQAGGTYLSGVGTQKTAAFDTGLENLSVDVSDQVYKWLDSTDNNGFLIKLPDSVVSGSETLYTKKFFSRTSEFFHYRPVLEARWDSARKDSRGNFFISSSIAPAADNINTLYLYNVIRGQLKNIPGLDGNTLSMEIRSGSSAPVGSALQIEDIGGTSVSSVVAGLLQENGTTVTGVYTASFSSTSSYDTTFDVWHTTSLGGEKIEFYTGSYQPKAVNTTDNLNGEEYITSITNLEDSYTQGQKPQIRVFPRKKNWNPNIYTVASSEVSPEIIEDSYYQVHRTIDGMTIIPYGTGSSNNNFTKMSYDVSGNYFDLDTSYLESGYAYGITFAYYLQDEYKEQPEVFKFRIKEEDK
jgi:hypothetical protein